MGGIKTPLFETPFEEKGIPMDEVALIKEIITKLEELQKMQRPHSDDFHQIDEMIAALTVKITIIEIRQENRKNGL